MILKSISDKNTNTNKKVSILILGSSGFLGKTLYYYLKPFYTLKHTGLSKRKYHLNNIEKIEKFLINNRFNYIINCAAMTDVDRCEEKKKQAYTANVGILKIILDLKKKNKLNFKLIHFSTDQVYNSKNFNYYHKERDISKKYINYYVYTKKKAENLCLKRDNNDVLILRTNFLGKSHSKKKSFSDWLFSSILKNKNISLASDSLITPLRTVIISKIIKKIINDDSFKSGIFNLGSHGGLSKLKIGKFFINRLNKKFTNYKITKINKIVKIKRPLNMMMNSDNFSKKFNIKLPKLNNELKSLIKEYESKN
jgi:dTDP-4-dehydrorhamnose reductase